MKAFLNVRSSAGGLHTVLVLAEYGSLDLRVDGDIVTILKKRGNDEERAAAIKMTEHYFVTIGEEPPTKVQHQAG